VEALALAAGGLLWVPVAGVVTVGAVELLCGLEAEVAAVSPTALGVGVVLLTLPVVVCDAVALELVTDPVVLEA